MKKKIVYDVDFSQLEEKNVSELEYLDNKNILDHLHLQVTGVIDKKEEKLKTLLLLKEGDLIKLNKPIEKDIDIYVSDTKILSGKIVEIEGSKYLEVLKI